MSEWWTYRPSDFLLFSPRVYERLIESENTALWPWQWLAAALAAVALAPALRRRASGARAAFALVGAALVSSGWLFLWSRFAGVNWAAGWFAPAFWAAGAAFVLTAALARAPVAAVGASRALALGLMALAALYPLTGPALGRGWGAAEVVGIMPDPTALMALGLAALSSRLAIALALSLAPLVWALYATMTLSTLGAPQAWLMATGLVLFVFSLTLRLRTRAAT